MIFFNSVQIAGKWRLKTEDRCRVFYHILEDLGVLDQVKLELRVIQLRVDLGVCCCLVLTLDVQRWMREEKRGPGINTIKVFLQ